MRQSLFTTNFNNTQFYIYNGTTVSSVPRPLYYRGFTITLRHTTFGTTPLYE